MKTEGGRRKAEGGVLVCFPLKQEAAPFRKIATNKPGTAILLTGIGRQNAEKSLRKFLASGGSSSSRPAEIPASRVRHVSASQARLVSSLAPPSLVLTCGFAGGLNPDLKLGDVVFEMGNAPLSPPSGERVSARTGEGLLSKLLAVGAKPTKFFCADHVATTAAEKQKLRHETGADAVEMESAAIHAVCVEQGIPCVTVRVISDTASEDLPLDFNQLSRADKSLDYGKLFLAVAKSPGKIGALMKLQKQTQFAAERLAEVLGKVL
jgi:adenosylhomocysteine nucleosidase